MEGAKAELTVGSEEAALTGVDIAVLDATPEADVAGVSLDAGVALGAGVLTDCEGGSILTLRTWLSRFAFGSPTKMKHDIRSFR